MTTLFLVIEAFIGIVLVGLILLQPPKGDGFGAIGGQARMFNTSSRELKSGITQTTFVFAIAFYALAFFLGLFF